MAVESIGALYPTKIPGYADAADIQAALRAYHYGSYAYDTTNTSTASLEANSMAKFLFDIETDITALENRPSSGGEVDTTAPAAVDFIPAEIPDGFIWVDQDGSIGGAPIGATAVFTNSAPTTSLTTGTVWVDKDATAVLSNPFIPQAIIAAKGDLLAGTANDTVAVLSVGTNGQVLKANSATTSGLEWGTDSSYSAPTIGSTSIASGATVTTIAGLTLTAPTISTITNTGTVTLPTATDTLVGRDTTDTLTNKTLTAPKISLAYTAKTDNYTIADGDQNALFTMNAATAKSFSIPTDATFNFAIGTQIHFAWITGAGQPDIKAVTSGTTTVLSTGATSTAPKLRVANSAATAIKLAANSWLVVGDIA
jgi:hypothetical protein